ETLALIWQLRHTIVHNVGVITQSDAIKLRLLVRAAVSPMQVLAPTRDDIRYLKRFLDETAERANRQIGERLAELLTALHATDPGLFVPQTMADAVTRTFGFVLTVTGAAGTLPAWVWQDFREGGCLPPLCPEAGERVGGWVCAQAQCNPFLPRTP